MRDSGLEFQGLGRRIKGLGFRVQVIEVEGWCAAVGVEGWLGLIGLVCTAHRLLYHSYLGSRIIKKKMKGGHGVNQKSAQDLSDQPASASQARTAGIRRFWRRSPQECGFNNRGFEQDRRVDWTWEGASCAKKTAGSENAPAGSCDSCPGVRLYGSRFQNDGSGSRDHG